jgi:hypothetical protein
MYDVQVLTVLQELLRRSVESLERATDIAS